jgi:ABC-type Zn uptake system ZnuABC Zn-binding protein ZnuA
VTKLRRLDVWIRAQVAAIPPAARLLVMDHLSHGYFADRYGFRIVGAVIPSVSTGDIVGAKQLAALVKTIEVTGTKAIFVGLGENPDLARQIAAEAHVKVVTGLLDHSLTPANGPAPTYLAMMRYDVRLIAEALR